MASAQTMDDLAGFARRGNFDGAHRPAVVAFQAPRSVRAGETLTLVWQCRFVRRVVIQIDGPISLLREVDENGRLDVRAPRAGMLYSQIRIWGDGDSAGEPSQAESRTVRVDAPPVGLQLSADELRGSAGGRVRLSWQATGVTGVSIRRPLHGEVLDAPPMGTIELTINAVDEAIELVATNHGGDCDVARICRLHPIRARPDELRGELALLTQPWGDRI